MRAGLAVTLGVRVALGVRERLGEPVTLGEPEALRDPVVLLLPVSETVTEGLSVCVPVGLGAWLGDAEAEGDVVLDGVTLVLLVEEPLALPVWEGVPPWVRLPLGLWDCDAVAATLPLPDALGVCEPLGVAAGDGLWDCVRVAV